MNDNIISVELKKTIGDRYLSYALSTIVSRSLPDVRDGLKPVHRRLLYAMRELNLNPTSAFKKCARVVGDVIGKFHPHGDAAVYDAMVRLAQDFSVRYPLVEGQGNFGNIDGDNAAAMRYTEARLTSFAALMLEGLNEDAVDFSKTYDGENKEPVVMPAYFPNLLANGATGIAVGMATSIPPHNIMELWDALLLLLKKPSASIDELTNIVSAPDFPTGGAIVESTEALRSIYKTGRGSIRLRANYEIVELKRGQYEVVITDIPYMVQKSRLLEKMGELLEAKKLPLMGTFRDESAEDIRIVIEPKNGNVESDMLMELLYKNTELETRFPVNLNVLTAGNVPKLHNLQELLTAYLTHQIQVLCRRSQFKLNKINDRLHLLEGLLVAHLNIDEVIAIIKEEDEPKPVLMKRFSLSDIQAEAILNMKLRHLRKLEEIKIKEEQQQLQAERDQLNTLLASEAEQKKHIAQGIKELKKQFGKKPITKRRTILKGAVEAVEITTEALVQKEAITVVLSKMGWLKAYKGHNIAADSFKFKDGDQLQLATECHTTDKILLFATNGRFYTLNAHEIQRGKGFGEALRLAIDLEPKENILAAFKASESDSDQHILLATIMGRGFKVKLEHAIAQTRNGKQIMNVTPGEPPVIAMLLNHSYVAFMNSNRKMLILQTEDIPELQRGRGVVLQKFKEGKLRDAIGLEIDGTLQWPVGDKTRTVNDFTNWLGKRAQAGRLAPFGFPRDNRFTGVEFAPKE